MTVAASAALDVSSSRSNQYAVAGARESRSLSAKGTPRVGGGGVTPGPPPLHWVRFPAAPLTGAVPVPYRPPVVQLTAAVAVLACPVIVTSTLPELFVVMAHVEPRPIMTAVRLTVPAGFAGRNTAFAGKLSSCATVSFLSVPVAAMVVSSTSTTTRRSAAARLLFAARSVIRAMSGPPPLPGPFLELADHGHDLTADIRRPRQRRRADVDDVSGGAADAFRPPGAVVGERQARRKVAAPVIPVERRLMRRCALRAAVDAAHVVPHPRNLRGRVRRTASPAGPRCPRHLRERQRLRDSVRPARGVGGELVPP